MKKVLAIVLAMMLVLSAAAMAETTWFTAEEALGWGLVDRVEETVAAAACATHIGAASAECIPRHPK